MQSPAEVRSRAGRRRRLLIAAEFLTGHGLACACAFACLVVLPSLAVVGLYFVLLAAAIVLDEGIGSPVALPAWFVLAALIGSATAVVVVLVGVTSDAVRRLLGWPLWTAPAAVLATAVLGAAALSLASAPSLAAGLGTSALLSALAAALVATYWMPLASVALAFRVARAVVARLRAGAGPSVGRGTPAVLRRA